MNTIKYFLTSLIILLAYLLPINTEATSNIIGVFRENEVKYKLFDPSDGSELIAGRLSSSISGLSITNFKIANLFSNVGTEWITENSNGKVLVYDQTNNLVGQFRAFTSNTNSTAIAVANVADEHAGPEIVVCKKNSSITRIKVFSYDEDMGEEKISGFKPFGTSSAHRDVCVEVGVGDVRGDGSNRIVVFRGDAMSNDIQVYFFDSLGVVDSTFILPAGLYEWRVSGGMSRMYVDNIDNTDKDEIIFQGDVNTVYVYNGEGDQLYEFNSQTYNHREIKKIDVADIDGDGVAEVLVQEKGKKVPILILNAVGEVEAHYNLYPSATHNAARFMFLGDFSTEL